LRDSIKVFNGAEKPGLYHKLSKSKGIYGDMELSAIIVSFLFYARFVEFGTAPHINLGEFPDTLNPGFTSEPFFYPGFRARKKDSIARINKAARKAIKAASQGSGGFTNE
jgi:hypothetical protein